MKKSTVYLPESLAARLRRIAEAEGRSQAEIIREAIAAYPEPSAPRSFRCVGVADGPGDVLAGLPEEELLEGFGES